MVWHTSAQLSISFVTKQAYWKDRQLQKREQIWYGLKALTNTVTKYTIGFFYRAVTAFVYEKLYLFNELEV